MLKRFRLASILLIIALALSLAVSCDLDLGFDPPAPTPAPTPAPEPSPEPTPDPSDLGQTEANTCYYNQLTEEEKEIYREILADMLIYDFDVDFTGAFDYDKDRSKTEKAFVALTADRPDLFWMGRGYDYHIFAEKWMISIKRNVETDELIEANKILIENKLNQIRTYISLNADLEDDASIAKALYDYLVLYATYDSRTLEEQTMLGIMVNLRGVCASFAAAYQYVLQSYGIPCIFIGGTGIVPPDEGGPHAWNAVQINGSWYLVDVTWGQNATAEGTPEDYHYKEGLAIDYTWLCRSDVFMITTHIPSELYFSPECPEDYIF